MPEHSCGLRAPPGYAKGRPWAAVSKLHLRDDAHLARPPRRLSPWLDHLVAPYFSTRKLAPP